MKLFWRLNYFFIKHRVVFTIMVRINDNVYTVVKKFNNDANMIKKKNKWEVYLLNIRGGNAKS